MTLLQFAPASLLKAAPAGWEGMNWASTDWLTDGNSNADQALVDAAVDPTGLGPTSYIKADSLTPAGQNIQFNMRLAVYVAAVTLPAATITALAGAPTTGFPAAGTLRINGQNVTYTGKTATTFTGCSGGTGAVAAGQMAVLVSGSMTLPARATVVRAYVQVSSGQTIMTVNGGIALWPTYTPPATGLLQSIPSNRWEIVPPIGVGAALSTGPSYYSARESLSLWGSAELRTLALVIQPQYLGYVPDDWQVHHARLVVEINEVPTVTVSVLSATQTTAPTVTWGMTDVENQPQEQFRVKVFTAAEYGAGGFDPEVTPSAIDSGLQVSSASFWPVGNSVNGQKALVPGTTYRAYVQAAEVGANGRLSAPAFVQFTSAVEVPAAPTLTAVADSVLNRVLVSVAARDNLLTLDQGGSETSVAGWVALANTTVSRQTAQFMNGSASMRMRATGAGTIGASTLVGTAGVPVTAGQQYTALANFRAAATARAVNVGIIWYNAAGGVISTSTGSNVNDTTAGWTQGIVTATAPALAAFAAVKVQAVSAAASEDHYVDESSIAPGASTVWTRGGLVVPDRTTTVERSDDGGQTWAAVYAGRLPVSMTTHAASFYDYTAPPNTAVSYRAFVTSVDSVYFPQSDYSATAAATVAVTKVWLKDPANPARNIVLSVLGDLTMSSEERQGVFQPLGRRFPVVLSDVIGGERIPATLQFSSEAAYNAFELLRSGMTTLLLQDDMTHQWWVHFGAVRTPTLRRTRTRRTAPYRTVTVEFIEVDPLPVA